MDYTKLTKTELIRKLELIEKKNHKPVDDSAIRNSLYISTAYQTLFEVSPSGILFLNDSGQIIAVNPALCSQLNYQESELTGKHVSIITHPDARNEIENNIQQLFRGITLNHTVKSITKCGTIRYMELSERCIILPDGRKGIISFSQDVTNHVQTEKELQREKERIQAVLDSVPGEISWIDSKLRYCGVNEYLCQITGLKPADFIGKKIGFSNENDFFKKFIEEFNASERNWVKKEVTNVVKGNSRSYILSAKKYGKGKYTALVGLDISERKKMEQALKLQKDFSRDIIQTAPVLIIILDKPDIIFDFNNYAEKVTGYTADEVLGKSWIETFIPENNRKKVQQNILQLFKGKKIKNKPTEIVTRDGSKHFIVWHNALLNDPIRKRLSVLAIGVDVTDSKKMEEQLRHSQKMEAIGKLAGGIAHDFNNLLTVIRGYTELLLMVETTPSPLKHKLTQIDSAAEKATALTAQLLAFSKKQVLSPIVLDINTLLKDLKEMLKRYIGEDIELNTTFFRGIWSVKADPNQMQQVIMNLTVNAREAMPRGGKIFISTENISTKYSLPVYGSDLPPGDYIVIRVRDTGIGISGKNIDKIFEPFYTTKDSSKGSGLGLATVYGIIQQSNGEIAVSSTEEEGTEFKIYLPRWIRTKEESKKTIKPKTEKKQEIPILVVEDDSKVRSLVGETLAANGYKVFEAANGEEAMKVFLDYEKQIKIILTDLVMPKMNGRQFSKKVKERNKKVKILFMSGYANDVMQHKGLLEPGMQIVNKPFKLSKLLSKLKELQLDNKM